MLRNYLLLAFKVLLRRKFFTLVSLFGICFTLLVLVVTAAIFEQVYVGHPPEVHADRTLGIFRFDATGPDVRFVSKPGYLILDRYIRTLPDVERVSIYSESQQVVSYHQDKKISSVLRRTDGEYWQILEFQFIEGRPFSADDEANANLVAVINRTTRERFFGSESALGKTLLADGQHFRVVGVVEDVSNLRDAPFSDIWVPLSSCKTDSYRYQVIGGFGTLILAHKRADFPLIKAEIRSRFAAAELPSDSLFDTVCGRAETETESKLSFAEPNQEPPVNLLLVLYGSAFLIMLLFMLLPGINLVNLNISRIIERSAEIGVRKAFGASSRALVAQLLVENIVLTIIGGLMALVAATGVLVLVNSSGIIPYSQLQVNPLVFLSGLVMALIFGLVSGVYPAWRMSRLDPALALSGRTS